MLKSKEFIVILINVILLQCCQNTTAYTQISAGGNNGGNDGGPKLYKAVNFDLLFPKSFNSSENVVSTTPETIPLPTKTATSVVGQPYYPLPQSNEPLYTAARAYEKLQEPIVFVTPATPTTEPATLAATSNEAVIYDDAQQNINDNKYNSQVVTKTAINMQQTKKQQEQEQKQQQQHNDNNKVENEQEQEQEFATGRAVDYHNSYPFGQVITPLIKNAARPVYHKPITSFPVYSPSSLSSSSLAAVKLAAPSNVGKIIYPQARYQQKSPSQAEIDKLHGKGSFRDRFSPSEGVASHAFKSNNDHSYDHTHDHHNHAPSYKTIGKMPSSSNMVNSYVTPSNLYAFPPNNVNYPVQQQDNRVVGLNSGSADSYTWPASGSLKDSNLKLNTAGNNNNPYQYNGPVSADYLPPANEGVSGESMDKGKNNDDSDLDNGAGYESIGVLPASAMDQDDGNSNSGMADAMDGVMIPQDDKKIPDDNSYDTGKEYPTPPPGWLKEHPESVQDHPHYDHHPKKPDIEFVQDHGYHHQPDVIYDHDHYHHSLPSYSSFPLHHHYPEIIYDDHHHHDHPHIEHPPPVTTTEAPPPEPPPEPRVKKYSYFYIGRKLWYIPLYFTVWFSFYVLWLILKSIARHKVNLPNHYVSRRSVDSDVDFSQRHKEIINQLTVSVLDNIDKFKRKYIK